MSSVRTVMAYIACQGYQETGFLSYMVTVFMRGVKAVMPGMRDLMQLEAGKFIVCILHVNCIVLRFGRNCGLWDTVHTTVHASVCPSSVGTAWIIWNKTLLF